MNSSGKNNVKYSDVGIDVDKIKSIQNSIGKSIKSTHILPKKGKVVSGYGHYAGLIEFNKKIMTLHTDGVGSKILVAQAMNKYNTIGIDCIAMNVNDTVCLGATPVGYLSYVALEKTNDNLLKEITKGLVKGAIMSNVAIVGGETAILSDIITGQKEGHNFDLAGMVLGILENKRKMIRGDKIIPGDVIIGIKSSGIHSNGLTLAREVLLKHHGINDKPDFIDKSVGAELLTPTAIYSNVILKVVEKFATKIHGLAHITGGAFTKLKRLNGRVDYVLDNLPVISGVFRQIMVDGNISEKEMYRTFNMGIGFCIIAARESADEIIETICNEKMKSGIIGNIRRNGKGNSLIKSSNDNGMKAVQL
ncbi:phosphoribosylformylglycinamidine cyclo-ligase [soil metagenome]